MQDASLGEDPTWLNDTRHSSDESSLSDRRCSFPSLLRSGEAPTSIPCLRWRAKRIKADGSADGPTEYPLERREGMSNGWRSDSSEWKPQISGPLELDRTPHDQSTLFQLRAAPQESASLLDVPLNVRAKRSSSQAANDSSHDFTHPFAMPVPSRSDLSQICLEEPTVDGPH